ncbi:6971_t:CDS:2 [Funneliformis geosporum]|uniref:6971_t:CDS:1 n=1 Tax=Funneliformis geosporum TaxID=1117311 RepID=A0A9W4SAV5_9GLOM|nr:6971_t:CDS:2 [Funneliformis geosporum]
MTFLITQQFKQFKQFLSILPSKFPTTTLYFLPTNHIFLRSYTARKPTKLSNSSAPIYARRELEDGSIIAPVSKEKRDQLEEAKNAEIEDMGWKKRFIRKERTRRRELW